MRELIAKWRAAADQSTECGTLLTMTHEDAKVVRILADELESALAAETGRGEVERYRAALQKIADGEVESRYAREDLLRALHQIQAVRDFAHETLKPQTEEASRGK